MLQFTGTLRIDPTYIADITGHHFTFLMNGFMKRAWIASVGLCLRLLKVLDYYGNQPLLPAEPSLLPLRILAGGGVDEFLTNRSVNFPS